MRAVMLAAGDGGRLGHLTARVPKPLVSVDGRPIVAYTMEALAAAGVDEVVVVTGYREAQVRDGLRNAPPSWPRRYFVSNPHFDRGASFSLRAARDAVGEQPFLLVMSDHLLSPALLNRLRNAALMAPRGRSFVAADYATRDVAYADEATKLAVSPDHRVEAIGKQLRSWEALDTGAFYVDSSAWDAFERAPHDCELSDLFRELAADRRLFAADVSGAFWYDVDTLEDLEAAEALIAAERLLRDENVEPQAAG